MYHPVRPAHPVYTMFIFFINLCKCIVSCIYIYIYVYIYIYIYKFILIFMLLYIYFYIHMHVQCLYKHFDKYMYILIYISTEHTKIYIYSLIFIHLLFYVYVHRVVQPGLRVRRVVPSCRPVLSSRYVASCVALVNVVVVCVGTLILFESTSPSASISTS